MKLEKLLIENNINISKIKLGGVVYDMTREKVIELIEGVGKEEYYLTLETLENLVNCGRKDEVVEFLENMLKIIILQNNN